MQQNILLHTGPGHAWKLFSAWFSVLPTMKSFRIFRAIFSDSFEDFLKVFLRKTFRKSFKTILEYYPKYSQRNHCRTTENHADNQFSQAGFRPLCNKIPFLKFWLSDQYNTNMMRLFIIRLVLSHIDHCAIKIKKKINEFLCETEGCQVGEKPYPYVCSGKEFPALTHY